MPALRRAEYRVDRGFAGVHRVGVETEAQEHFAHRLACFLEVVYDEYPGVVFNILRQARPRRFVAPLQGQFEPEAAAFSRRARAADPSAHHLGQALADRQAETRSAVLARGRDVSLLKDLEQPTLFIFAHANPGIADFEADAQGVVCSDRIAVGFDHPAAHEYPPALGELDRVADVVEQDLADAVAVAMQRRRQMVGVDDQLDILRHRLVAHHVGNAEQHALDREVALFQVQLAGLDLREIEHVVDDAEQVVCRVLDLAEANERARVADLAAQKMRQPDDRIHRRADLVAHVGEEGALCEIGFLGRQLGRCEFGGALLDATLQAGVQRPDRLLGEPRFGHIVIDGKQLAFAAGDDEAAEDRDLPDRAIGTSHLDFQAVFRRRFEHTAPVAGAVLGIHP